VYGELESTLYLKKPAMLAHDGSLSPLALLEIDYFISAGEFCIRKTIKSSCDAACRTNKKGLTQL